MINYYFTKEDDLQGVVDPNRIRVFCKWKPNEPITEDTQLTRDVCGHMFSALCGFKFTSAKSDLENASPEFWIIYAPKSRSTHVRGDKGLSGWYVWQVFSETHKVITEPEKVYDLYGFNLSKFFQSDFFNLYIKKFEKWTLDAYDTVVKDYIDSTNAAQSVRFFAKCVFDSVTDVTTTVHNHERIQTSIIPQIELVLNNSEIPDSSISNAKVAYNANSTYQLNNPNANKLARENELSESNGYPEYDVNCIADLESIVNMCYNEYDMDKRDHLVFRDANGKEMKIIEAKVLNNGLNFTLDY